MYKTFFKRFLDLLLAIVILLVTLPIWISLIIVLYQKNKGAGVFFVQPRIGKANTVFNIYKFKTMTEERDRKGQLLPDELRLTKIGSFIRSTSLDELPQLINVIKGDMSFIGPRPLLVDYLPLYRPFQLRRHDVIPGITGWAQINGRNSISWQKKFELDVWYVDNFSFRTDVKIFFLTIIRVVRRQGISAENNVTMERFNGDN